VQTGADVVHPCVQGYVPKDGTKREGEGMPYHLKVRTYVVIVHVNSASGLPPETSIQVFDVPSDVCCRANIFTG
jgi:hypothetical protein